MTTFTHIALTGIAISITIMMAATMLFYEGRATLNTYGEGWIEVGFTGLVALAGLRGVRT